MRRISATRAAAVGERDGRALAAGEVFHLALARGEFVVAGDERDAEAALVGVLELLAELLRLGIDLDAEPGGAQLRGELQVVVEARGVEDRE